MRKLIPKSDAYKNFFSHSRDMFCIAGFDGYFKELNLAWEKTLGFTKKELLEKPFLDFIHPDDRQKTADQAKLQAQGQDAVHFENRYLCKDGSYRWLLWEATPIPGEQLIIAAARDITERKAAEIVLERLKCSLDKTSDSIFIFRANDLRFVYVNGGARRQVGYSETELLAMTPVDLKPGFTPEKCRELLQPLFEGTQSALSFETVHRHKDGHDIPIEISVQIAWQPDGERCLVAIARDITDRRRMDAELETLRKSLEQGEERFRKIVEFSPTAKIVVDPEGKIVLLNAQAEKLFLYARQDLIGKPIEVLIPARYREGHSGHVGGFSAHPQARAMGAGRDLFGLRKDGKEVPIEIGLNPIETSTGRFVLAAIVDLTDRKALEHGLESQVAARTLELEKASEELQREANEKEGLRAQLLQSQKMEAVGRLAGGVAHDFNNILTAISGYSQFLLASLAPDDNRRDDVAEIVKAGERAAGLTRQLLAFSRQQVLQLKIIDCNALVANLEKMLRRIIGEDVELSATLAPESVCIKADPGQVEQVILNLVINAKDAMPKGGKITIETSRVEVGADFARTHLQVKAGSYMMFAISDTGTGMDSHTREHLFEPFFTTKEQGKGTGLGLATVYGIVKQSGGGVYVYSELGHGSIFKVYFPRVEEATHLAQDRLLPAQPCVGSETILLVEDDEAVRKFILRALLERGYVVLPARGPAEAVGLCEQHKNPIHLILSDVIMPQMHGPELVKRLIPLHPEAKVLYMSGYTDTTVAHRDLVGSGTPFLQKPISLDVLASTVRKVLDSVS